MRSSEHAGPLTAFAEVAAGIGEDVRRYKASSPRARAIVRGKLGSGLLTTSAYGVWFAGGDAGDLLTAFAHSPASAPVEVWLPLALWAGATALGGIWLASAVRASAGPRDGLAAFWAAVRIAVFVGIMMWVSHAPGWSDWAQWLNLGLGLFIVMDAVGFCLNLRSGRAARIVSRQIEAHAVSWRTARRRGVMR